MGIVIKYTKPEPSLLDGPAFEAIVAAVCREGDTAEAIDELVELLAA